MARGVKRTIPGPDDYPGKHYFWVDESEARMLYLEHERRSAQYIADRLNAEFPQPLVLTRSAVIAKMWRMRGGAKYRVKAPFSPASYRGL